MSDQTRWSWIMRGLEGNVNLAQMLVEEGCPISNESHEQLGQLADRLAELQEKIKDKVVDPRQ